MSPDWRYRFETDYEVDADVKKFRQWKNQGIPFKLDRPKLPIGLFAALLGAATLIMYLLARAS